MANQNPIDPNHKMKRGLLRVIGVIILLIGIILLIVGMIDFFSTSSDPFGSGPKMFWLNFVALPLIFVGVVMTSAGYMGAVARYQAEEIAPVGKDTINYMAQETKDSVRTIAHSIKEGLAEGEATLARCAGCGKSNPQNAAFCNGCGAPLKSKACSYCGYKNPPDASFCNGCGKKLS